MKSIVNAIPYIVLLMTFWDFTIHVIDKRDRKFLLTNQYDKTWGSRLRSSKSFLSYYYPHFWGKKVVSQEKSWKRYDYFWLTYWGLATFLLIVYVAFR